MAIGKKYQNYLLSNEWAQLKIDIYEARGRKCEQCGNTRQLHIHHLTYKNIYNEEPEDLIILCKPCHEKEHNIKSKKKKPIKKTKNDKGIKKLLRSIDKIQRKLDDGLYINRKSAIRQLKIKYQKIREQGKNK